MNCAPTIRIRAFLPWALTFPLSSGLPSSSVCFSFFACSFEADASSFVPAPSYDPCPTAPPVVSSSFSFVSCLIFVCSFLLFYAVILNSLPPSGLPPFFFRILAFFFVSFSSSYRAKSSWMSRPENMDVRSWSLTVIWKWRAMPSARCLPKIMKSSSLN